MDKSAIDTPSREIDLRNIPVHLRTALRRALEFEARAPAPRSAEEAEQCEEQLRAIADEFFGALLTPVLQRAVRSAAVGDAASALVRHLPRRMRSDGLETVNVRTSRGTTVPVTTPYYREKHARRAKRRPGLYPALVVLGIYDRCTPKLASDASRAVAMLSSLAEAQAQLRSDGIALDIKTLRSTAYRYAARARAAQQSAACGLLDRVTGKRVVVSLDGGRVRVRRKKRGPKTKKGRNRFHTDWKEPKLLILYVVGDDGRPSQTWAPIIDGTLRGPESATGPSPDARPCGRPPAGCARPAAQTAAHATPRRTRCAEAPSTPPGCRPIGANLFSRHGRRILACGCMTRRPCCRARGTDRNWTRVDRNMLWSPAASSSQQRARVLTDVKARRFAPPPLRGADGLDAGSAHARPDWLLPTMLTHTPPTCCGRRPVQNDALSGDR